MKCNKCGKGPSDSCMPFQGHDFPDGNVVSAMKRKLEANQRNLGMVMKENRENLERAEKAEESVVELREAITKFKKSSGLRAATAWQGVERVLASSTDAGKKS